MGRVSRDDDGFTVYSTDEAPAAFRVWNDDLAGDRCTCDRFNRAFRAGREYSCEHILAVGLWLDPPTDVLIPVPDESAEYPPLRRVV
jgi:hypothetical protein